MGAVRDQSCVPLERTSDAEAERDAKVDQ